jgi:hypothetical protein
MRITRTAFDDAQVNTGPSGAESRKMLRKVLDQDGFFTIVESDRSETRVGRDNRGKFTFAPIAKG